VYVKEVRTGDLESSIALVLNAIAGSQRELVLGVAGRDQDVPELSNNVPYDPFKVDIFTIGNVLRGEIQAVGFHSPRLISLAQFRTELHQPRILHALDRAYDANRPK
jgi:hypothetical protein